MANKMIEKYNAITSKTLADAIDKHPKDWQTQIANNRMFNVSGEKPVAYQGVNAVNLAISNANRGNTDNRFMTRVQAEKAGFSINDGAKAMAISYLQIQNREVDGKQVKIPMMRVGYVYNAKDIKGIGKAQVNDGSSLGLAAEQLLKKSSIKVVQKGTKAFYDDKNKTIVLPEKPKSEQALISSYAVIASKVAVEQNYVNDSKDMQAFKSQMSAALITQKAGASFEPEGIEKPKTFSTDFLKNSAVSMKAIRSSAKIANFVIDGKSFEMTKSNNQSLEQAKKQMPERTKAVVKTKDTKSQAKTPKKGGVGEKVRARQAAEKEKGRGGR